MPVGRLLAIAIGGVVGATIRWGLSELITSNTFPWPTLIANVVGSALLAWVLVRPLPPTLGLATGTGFCGGLTTFSTFSLEIVEGLDEGDVWLTLAYVALSMLASIASFIAVRRVAGAAG